MSNVFRVKNSESGTGKPTRFYSNLQEKAIAKATGGKQTKNSGATLFQKGDILTEDWILEAKTRTSNQESISIKREWFEKQINEMIQMGKKYSAIVINFGPDFPYNQNHYIINEELFLELLDYLQEKED